MLCKGRVRRRGKVSFLLMVLVEKEKRVDEQRDTWEGRGEEVDGDQPAEIYGERRGQSSPRHCEAAER